MIVERYLTRGKCLVLLFLAAHASDSGAARANDGHASLAAGGIKLVHSPTVEMRTEDLFISRDEIRVSYRFFNTAPTDVKTIVVFPMPEAPSLIERMHMEYDPARVDPVNFLKFKTTVDGKNIDMRTEIRAFAGGIDHTDKLKELNIPLDYDIDGLNAAIAAAPPGRLEELVTFDVLRKAIASNNTERFIPAWSLRISYYWEQTFPTQKEVTIEHRYAPWTGSSMGDGMWEHGLRAPDRQQRQERRALWQRFQKDYCATDKLLRDTQRSGKNYIETYVGYILTTANTWANPIGRFRLVVDTGDPDSIAVFCADGIKNITPTQYEVRRTNYAPEKDLKILILHGHPRE